MSSTREDKPSVISRLKYRLRNGWKLVSDPAGWSADWYRRSNKMYYSATMPETWRRREDIHIPDETETD